MSINTTTTENNIQRFEQLLGSVNRKGIKNLMKYITNHTDFYSAPASTRFHLSSSQCPTEDLHWSDCYSEQSQDMKLL